MVSMESPFLTLLPEPICFLYLEAVQVSFDAYYVTADYFCAAYEEHLPDLTQPVNFAV